MAKIRIVRIKRTKVDLAALNNQAKREIADYYLSRDIRYDLIYRSCRKLMLTDRREACSK